MSGFIKAVSDIELDGVSAFQNGGTGNIVFGAIPVQASMLAATLYIDEDCKEIGFLDSSGQRCVEFLGEESRIILEDMTGLILSEDGTMFLRY
jgi:hypothetical protein